MLRYTALALLLAFSTTNVHAQCRPDGLCEWNYRDPWIERQTHNWSQQYHGYQNGQITAPGVVLPSSPTQANHENERKLWPGEKPAATAEAAKNRPLIPEEKIQQQEPNKTGVASADQKQEFKENFIDEMFFPIALGIGFLLSYIIVNALDKREKQERRQSTSSPSIPIIIRKQSTSSPLTPILIIIIVVVGIIYANGPSASNVSLKERMMISTFSLIQDLFSTNLCYNRETLEEVNKQLKLLDILIILSGQGTAQFNWIIAEHSNSVHADCHGFTVINNTLTRIPYEVNKLSSNQTSVKVSLL